LRATRVFDAGLLLLTRLRTLAGEAALVVRFDLGFALEAAPVFFVFELVAFLDLLRATIANLSTRKLSRTRYDPRTNTALTGARILLSERRVDFASRKTTCVFARDAQRLPLDG
jgi:hypothetical protein